MSSSFDPYYLWLGIPKRQQPADHYRLLGIEQFEDNRDVISNAADGRMIHLRALQWGDHSRQSQEMLNDVASARVCLLNPQKKSAYDAELRARLAGGECDGNMDSARDAARTAKCGKSDIFPRCAKSATDSQRGWKDGSNSAAGQRTIGWLVPAVIGGAFAALIVETAIIISLSGSATTNDSTAPVLREPVMVTVHPTSLSATIDLTDKSARDNVALK